MSKFHILDALYGDIYLDDALRDLAVTPAVQRLRHIRLSNIDSSNMPGIAGITRYEHALGTAHLAWNSGVARQLSPDERLLFTAAAMLHDSAIAPYGHLVEEALGYAGVQFNHETKWLQLLELGGAEFQMPFGRVSGLRKWALSTFGPASCHGAIRTIFEIVSGRGRLGRCIVGAIDLDNLDNLVRLAFHMGLHVERALPLRVAYAMTAPADRPSVLFDDSVQDDLRAWLELRRRVYGRLMLAPQDLCAKVMLLAATVGAYEHGDFAPEDCVWMMDHELIDRLTSSGAKNVRKIATDWLAHEQWTLADPLWMTGETVPSYAAIYGFSQTLSEQLRRECFAYRIVDKRQRRLTLSLRSGVMLELGAASSRWLLAVGSPVARKFSASEQERLSALAEAYFSARVAGIAKEEEGDSESLFGEHEGAAH